MPLLRSITYYFIDGRAGLMMIGLYEDDEGREDEV